MKNKYEGFVVLGFLIAMIIATTIVAINPASNFAAARDASRRSDITTILNAISQYNQENYNFQLGTDLDGDMIPNCDNEDPIEIGVGKGVYDLDESGRIVPGYLVAMPFDPQMGTSESTGYTFCISTEGRITVSALYPEVDKTISVTR